MKLGTKFIAKQEVEVPIMPPVLYETLSEGRTYEIVGIDNDELELKEIPEKGAVHQRATITLKQLTREIKENKIEVITN